MLFFFLQLFFVFLLVLPFYLLVRFLFYRRHKDKESFSMGHEVALAVFVLFLCGLLTLVFRPSGAFTFDNMFHDAAERLATGRDIVLTPFTNIGRFFRAQFAVQAYNAGFALSSSFAVNILGNVLMFVPIGFFPPSLWEKWRKFWKMLLVALLFPMFIEFVQLFIGRTVDIDDVILNATGVLLGYGFYKLVHFVRKRLRKGTAATKDDDADTKNKEKTEVEEKTTVIQSEL